MAESIRKVDLFSVELPHKPGEGAAVLAMLRDAQVSLHAAWGYPVGKKARLDLIPAERAAFTKAAKKGGLTVGPRQGAFLLEAEDHIGALAAVLAKLGGAGINVIAAQAVTAGEGRYGAVIHVGAEDYRKAAKLIGA